LLLGAAIFIALASCTTWGPARAEPGPPFQAAIPEHALLPAALPAPERRVPIDEAIKKVKANSPEIVKSFTVESGDDITVFGDIDGYRVVYDLQNALPQEGQRFLVAFSMEAPGREEKRDDSFLWTAEEDGAGVLLSMDDNYQDDWEAYFDTFDRYGAKITFFIQGEFCRFCQEARNRGHDIGYHTHHHLNLTQVSKETFDTEAVSGIDQFRRAGIPLDSFAYPYGLSEPWMIDALTPFFQLQRGYGVTFVIYRKEKLRGYIASKAIDNILFKEESHFERTLYHILLITKFLGGGSVAPFTTHAISDNAQWGIKPARLEYLLKTIQELNLKFYLFSDFVEMAPQL
jgi:peptidoglycan/xylan/chitin deacetylase (PgdA/CDA1 family)